MLQHTAFTIKAFISKVATTSAIHTSSVVRTFVSASSRRSPVGLHDNLKVALFVAVESKIPTSCLSCWDIDNKVGVWALIRIIPTKNETNFKKKRSYQEVRVGIAPRLMYRSQSWSLGSGLVTLTITWICGAGDVCGTVAINVFHLLRSTDPYTTWSKGKFCATMGFST